MRHRVEARARRPFPGARREPKYKSNTCANGVFSRGCVVRSPVHDRGRRNHEVTKQSGKSGALRRATAVTLKTDL